MNFGESSGDSSSDAQENGASASSDCERPHKKARFPWQIKGKHHLKNQTIEPIESSSIAPAESELVIPSPECQNLSDSLPQCPLFDTPTLRPPKAVVPFSNTIPIDSSRTSLGNVVNPNTIHSRRLGQGSIMPLFSPTDLIPLMPLETVETMLLHSEINSNTISSHEVIHEQSHDSAAGPSNFVSATDAHRLRKQEEKCISRWQAAQVNYLIKLYKNLNNLVPTIINKKVWMLIFVSSGVHKPDNTEWPLTLWTDDIAKVSGQHCGVL